jgi:hypothetical protein
MERFDIVLTGLDPAQAKGEVIAALARRLAKSGAEIEALLESGPSIVARALEAADAQRLVEDLRKLGARVKPRAEGPEITTAEPEGETDAAPAKVELLYWSADDEGYERPRASTEDRGPEPEREPALVTADPPRAPDPVAAPPVSTPIVVHPPNEWFAPKSLPDAVAKEPIATPLLVALLPDPSPARHGRSIGGLPDRPERPRVFLRALPGAFLVPLRRPLWLGMAAAPPLGMIAMSLGIFGLDFGSGLVALGVAFAVGLVGLLLQLAASCLAATASGERMPAPLPTRLMDDYLYPGAGALFALGVLAMLANAAWDALSQRGAPPAALAAGGVLVVVYAVLGLMLSAANGSAIAYLDVLRIVRITARSPIRALVVSTVGAVTLGGSALGALLLVAAAAHSGDPLVVTLYAGALGLVSLAASYGAALTGALMGLLLYAKPEAAS